MRKNGGCSSIAGGITAALVLVILAMEAQGAMAQASCLSNPGAGAPFGDANTVVQALRTKSGQCCQTNCGGFCTVMLTAGNAAATICGDCSFCLSCAEVGNLLNVCLSQCNRQNEVQAAYGVNGSQRILYITSAANHP